MSHRIFLARTLRKRRGFALIVLLMCIAIMLLMTTAVLDNYPETSMRLNVNNTVHKLTALMREAQIRGSAVDSVNSSLGGYGMHFDLNSKQEVILFGDIIDASIERPYGLGVGNGLYNSTPISEKKKAITLLPGYSFKRICVTNATSYVCNNETALEIKSLTISFSRPSSLANIYINGDSAVAYSSACAEVHSPKSPKPGHIRAVQFYHSSMVTTSGITCN